MGAIQGLFIRRMDKNMETTIYNLGMPSPFSLSPAGRHRPRASADVR